MNYINIIKKGMQLDLDGKIYYLSNGQNEYVVKLLMQEDGSYSDIIQYKIGNSILWSLNNVEKFCKQFLIPKISIDILSKRFYGEPKLSKPEELKNIKQEFSVNFIPNKCKFQCFKKDNDLYVLCKDYFSQTFKPKVEDLGMPLQDICKKYFKKEKKTKNFIYQDSWGAIVLRNECWFKINNIYLALKIKNPLEIKNILIKQWCYMHKIKETEIDFCWENLFEEIINKIKKNT